MSSDSPKPPSPESFVETVLNSVASLTKTLTEFVRWIADMIRKRDWVGLLMFAIAVAIVFWGTKITLSKFIQEPIFYGIWIVIGVVLLLGIILELRKKPPRLITKRDFGKRKAIKFLSSFEQEDAEIYVKLQGYRDLGIILENIVRPEYKFGILKGKSGCGKSSYLKAGLLAELAKTDAYQGVYLKFSNQDSLETIKEAFVDALKLSQADIEAVNFLELLKKGIEAASQNCENFKSLILIFDQFEQFFVYTDDEARRKDFIDDLASCYNDNELADKVKILVSIREDWFARMDEIQEVLNYTLRIGSQAGGNSFYLKNFSPEEATMILKVMAQEDLEIAENDTERFNRDYIQSVLEKELISATVSSRDRLISPVDLQIIAETIKQQNTLGMRAFNEKVFQKLGGIEGLRRTFLENILEPLGEERKKSAVQVLVLLTNLENQTRAEVQTLSQLQEKVKGTIPANEAAKIVNYLHGTGLIAVVEQKGIKGYTLAHEGMIAAVIRMGEKIQDRAYRVNQLLERRVNEWLGNNRSSRYLFNLEELWSIEKQKPYLIWGSKRQQKQKLLAQSKGRIYRNFGLLGGILALSMGIWGWLNYTPWGQVTQIRWKLVNVIKDISDPKYQLKAVTAFAKDKNFKQALKLVDQIKKNSPNRAKALITIVGAIGKLDQPKKEAKLLQDAIASANQIENSSDRADALRTIVEAISKLNQPDKAAELLQDAIASANQIENSSDRANALRTIVKAISKLKQPETVADLLQQATNSATQIQDYRYQASALSDIAVVYRELKKPETAAELLQQATNSATQIQDYRYQASALSDIAVVYNTLTQSETAAELLQQSINSIDKIQSSYDQAKAFSTIVEAFSKLNQTQKAAKLLEQVITSANKNKSFGYEAQILKDIVKAISELGKPETEAELLQQTLNSFTQIEDPPVQAEFLRAIVEAISELGKPETEAELLQQSINSIDKMESGDPAEVLSTIVAAISKLNKPEKAVELLQQAIISANQMESGDQARVLETIAEAISNLKESKPEKAVELLQQAISSADKMEFSDYQFSALSAIAVVSRELNKSEKAVELMQQAISSAEEIRNRNDRANALKEVAIAIGELNKNKPKIATELLQQAIVSVDQIKDSDDQADALRVIVEAINQLNQTETKEQLLRQVISSAKQIKFPRYRAEALSTIAEAYSKLNQPETPGELLQDARASANQIEYSSNRTKALSTIAEAAANLKKWGQALKAVQQCPSDDCEVELLAKVLTIYAEQQPSESNKAEEEND